MRYDSNLAYDVQFEEFSNKREEKVQRQRKDNKSKARELSIKKHKTIAICALAISMCAGFMISRNVTVYEGNNRVKKLQKELNGLKEYSSQKAFELDKSINLDSVENIAATKLNMVRPEKYQTVYVNIKQDDVTEVTADKVEGLSRFFGIFGGEK